MINNKQKGELYVITSGLCYGIIGYLGITSMHGGMSVFNMSFWRFLIATIAMAILLRRKYKNILKNYKENLKIIFYGIVFYGISSILYFSSTKYLGTGLATVILFTYPGMVMILDAFLNKVRIKKVYYWSFFLIMIGIILLVDKSTLSFDLMGVGLSLASALLYACYLVANKNSSASPEVSTFMVALGCTLLSIAGAVLDSSFHVPSGWAHWANLIALGILCTVLPVLLVLRGLTYISCTEASLLSVTEPVFVVIFGIILLHEKISVLQFLGIVAILSGALLTLLPQRASGGKGNAP